MSTNSQNPAKGQAFKQLVRKWLKKQRVNVDVEYPVQVSINGRVTKSHKFDLGNCGLLVECKAYGWTEGGNSPSAKFATTNEAMLYFVAAPDAYKKMLFMPKTGKLGKRRPETLVEHYVRRYAHFIPDDVEIYELNESDLSAIRAWPTTD